MPDLRTERRVNADRLDGACDPAMLPFRTTEELHPLEAIFGQERAVRAIEFALGMGANGYNLYAAGHDGLGKHTIVQAFLRRHAAQIDPPAEWVYVHNFEDTDRPIAISLPTGQAHPFAAAVAEAVQQAADELRQTFESDPYVLQRQELRRSLETERADLIGLLQQQALSLGFALQMGPQGIVTAPVEDGQPITDEQFAALTDERRKEITANAQRLDRVVQESLLRMRSLERDQQQQVQTLDKQVAAFAVDHHFQSILERWGGDREIQQFIESVHADMIQEHARFRAAQQPGAMMPAMTPVASQQADLIHRYEVNVLVARSLTHGGPVVVERNPTYYNLIGRIEHTGGLGGMNTDHTMVRAGSLLLANGGYIVLSMRDLVANPQAYEALKRALALRAVAIENLNEMQGVVPTLGLRPEPIPLDVKVAIVGDGALYASLLRYDPDFRELFRVKADFEIDFERTHDNILGLASVVRAQCEQASLRHFTNDGVARLVEHSSRIVEDQRRLSANMGTFVDIIRQSDYWAAQDGATVVEAKHVGRALAELEYRSSLVRDRMQQMIVDGSMFITTTGAVVGQVNGLSVYDLGDISFGRPSRITCITSAGRGTIVNIERETEMAGPIHNKGFMILRGFLADRFGQNRALALNASMTFEQLYGGIEGDSASSTEIYALLSSLSSVPITQSFAVTGSVNQLGEVQPIGGATAKIEGFYDVCHARGLDGTQGVMIPHTNVPNVVLRPEVAQAIRDGKFHVWSVETIEQGIEVLTGVPAGIRGPDGKYPADTIFRRVEDRLDEFEQALKLHESSTIPTEAAHPGQQPAPPPNLPGTPPPPPPPPPIQV